MTRRVIWAAVAAICVIGLDALAARPIDGARAQDFYRGKTLRIITGSSLGGGFDVEARLLARHLSRHIPGSPRVVVDNTPGAGGLLAANLLARQVRPDGLTLGYLTLALPMAQLMRNPAAQFDVRTFEFVGAPYDDPALCFFSTASGISTFAQWRAATWTPRLGSTGPDSVTSVAPAILSAAFGLPMRVISGYRGAAELRLALASHEIDGACLGLGGTTNGWPRRAGITVVVQGSSTPHRGLAGVPSVMSFASTDTERALAALLDSLSRVSRSYAFPPGTPAGPRDVVRRAFLDVMKDPAYAREAAALSVDIDPATGDEVAQSVQRLLAAPPSVVDMVTRVLPR